MQISIINVFSVIMVDENVNYIKQDIIYPFYFTKSNYYIYVSQGNN
jgi:hypothetical protein